MSGGSKLPAEATVLRHFRAMSLGSRDKDCKAAFAKCDRTFEDILKVLAKQ